MIAAHGHQPASNTGKEQALLALFPAFRDTLANLSPMTVKELREGFPWRGGGSSHLSALQVKAAQNQVSAVHAVWPALREATVRESITGSTLSGGGAPPCIASSRAALPPGATHKLIRWANGR